LILCETFANPGFTVTLPTAVGITGRRYTVKDSGGNAAIEAIIVACNGAQTIDGSATKTISIAHGSITVESNGTNWNTVAQITATGGDMVLADAQTVSGIKTFLNTTMKLRNVANTFDGSFVNTNTADRIYTLQDRDGTLADDTDLALKAPLASPTFTGTVTIPTPFTIGAVSMTATGTELNYVAGVTSAIQTQLNAKFTLPALTTGSVLFSDGTTIAQDNSNFFWDDTNNRLGLGTTAPKTTFSILTTDTTGAVTNLYGTSTTVMSDYGITNLTTTADFVTSTIAGIIRETNVSFSSDPGSSKSVVGYELNTGVPSTLGVNLPNVNVTGFRSFVQSPGTNQIRLLRGAHYTVSSASTSGTIVVLEGGLFNPTYSGTGTVSQMDAAALNVTVSGAATVTNMWSTFGTMAISAGATVSTLYGSGITFSQSHASAITTNGYGFYMGNVTNSGTFTNLYGFYCGDITAGTNTNTPFSFYASDANAYNYFAGNVGIGTTAPSTLLHVGLAGTTLGTIGVAGNTSGLVTIRPAAAAGTWTMTLPTSSGTSGYLLQTDGTGVTTWAASSGGAGNSYGWFIS